MCVANTCSSGRWARPAARPDCTHRGCCALLLAGCALFPPVSLATTKGLNQIVTPDLQEAGQLTVSGQAQERAIGNPWEAQAELGLNDWVEVAAFQGFSPNERFAAAELGILRTQPLLLSAGFIGWSSMGDAPQPFIEAGWYHEHAKWIGGVLHAGSRTEALLGFAWDFNPRWRAQFDYQAGHDNASTFGITWMPNERWQLNPAVYRENAAGHALRGYFVASYSLQLWRH
jgi:hypothetical protein